MLVVSAEGNKSVGFSHRGLHFGDFGNRCEFLWILAQRHEDLVIGAEGIEAR